MNKEILIQLRKETGLGISECKTALENSNDNIEDAKKYLLEKGNKLDMRDKIEESKRPSMIECYIHSDKKIMGAVIISTDTEFALKTDEVKQLAKDLSAQVAAMNPKSILPGDLSPQFLCDMTIIYKNKAKEMGKPDNITEKIVNGQLRKLYKEVCLMEQPFIKEPKKNIKKLVSEVEQKIKEKIIIEDFVYKNVR